MKILSILQLFIGIFMLFVCIAGYVATTYQNGFSLCTTIVLAMFTILSGAILVIIIDELKEGGKS